MTKTKKLLFLLTLLCALCAVSALAEFAVVDNTSSLNLREGPGYDYNKIGSASKGDWVQIEGEAYGFYAVTVIKTGKTGYMDRNYLTTASQSTGSNMGTVNNPKSTSFLNLREMPSYSAKVLGIYYNGAQCVILSEYNGWYEVQIDGMTGYFRREFVRVSGSAGNVSTATIVTPGSTSLNLRSGPSTSYDVLGKYYGGRVVSVLLKGNSYYKVSVDGKEGYMAKSYLSESGSSSSSSGTHKPTTKGYVIVNNPNHGNYLNLREQPTTSSKILAQYKNGTRFEVIAQGETWCKLYGSASGRVGYMMTKYLKFYGLPGIAYKTVKNNNSYVNLRTKPSQQNSSVLVRVPSNKTVTVLTPGDEWTQVRYQNQVGYMMTYFLK